MYTYTCVYTVYIYCIYIYYPEHIIILGTAFLNLNNNEIFFKAVPPPFTCK